MALGLGGLVLAMALLVGFAVEPAEAMTAPELRSQKSLVDLQIDMHGRNLQQQEFLKAQLGGFDFSGADLRGAVFNSSDLRASNFSGADLEDVVAFASRFDGADLGEMQEHRAAVPCCNQHLICYCIWTE